MKYFYRCIALASGYFAAIVIAGTVGQARVTGNGNPPVIVSISSQDTSGGPVVFTGHNFGDGSNVKTVRVWCNYLSSGGRPGPALGREFLSVRSISATQINATIGAADAGTYDCRVENIGGAATVALGQLVIATTTLPSSICTGSTLRAWYRITDVLCSGVACNDGDTITSWTDLSGNGFTATCAGSVIYHTLSTGTCNGVPCFGSSAVALFNTTGSTGVCTWTGTNSLNSSTNLALWVNARQVTHVASANYAGVLAPSGNLFTINDAAASQVSCTALTGPAGNTTLGYPFQALTYNDTGTNVRGCAIANQIPELTTTSSTISTGANTKFTIGGANALNSNSEVTDEVICNTPYDATKWFNMAQYMSLRYALSAPNPVAVTNVGTGGGFYRVNGTNIVSGATIAVSGGLEAATTMTVNSMTSAQSTIPAGTYSQGAYNILITNPDGLVGSGNGIFHITSPTRDPMTIAGQFVEGWWDADDTTWQTCVTTGCPNGTKISAAYDKSFFDANMLQAVGADQLVLNVPDVAYTHLGVTHNSWTYDGAVTFMQTAGLNISANPYGAWVLAIGQENGATSGGIYNLGGGAQQSSLKFTAGTGKVSCFNQNGTSGTATFATNLNGVVAAMTCNVPAGANPTIDVNVGNGTAVTQATACAALTNTTRLQTIGQTIGPAAFYKGTTTQIVKLSGDPGSTIKANLETWAQGYNAP